MFRRFVPKHAVLMLLGRHHEGSMEDLGRIKRSPVPLPSPRTFFSWHHCYHTAKSWEFS